MLGIILLGSHEIAHGVDSPITLSGARKRLARFFPGQVDEIIPHPSGESRVLTDIQVAVVPDNYSRLLMAVQL